MQPTVNKIEYLFGSGFYTGNIKFASGTFGSLAGLIIYLIPGFENPTIMLFFISLFTVIGIKIGTKFEKTYGKDPKEFTLDEVVGMWISLLFIPKKIWYIALVFIIWRAMDIIKIPPARQAEKLKGGLGIMLDDIIAACYCLIITNLIINFIK
ncbi:MAG: phosphatidylglycerophosphatase A [bacterium]